MISEHVIHEWFCSHETMELGHLHRQNQELVQCRSSRPTPHHRHPTRGAAITTKIRCIRGEMNDCVFTRGLLGPFFGFLLKQSQTAARAKTATPGRYLVCFLYLMRYKKKALTSRTTFNVAFLKLVNYVRDAVCLRMRPPTHIKDVPEWAVPNTRLAQSILSFSDPQMNANERSRKFCTIQVYNQVCFRILSLQKILRNEVSIS